MPATLALVTNTPVAIARRTPLLYLRDAVTSPPFVSLAIIATTLGFWIAGGLGWAIALAVVVGGGMSSLRSNRVQRHLDRRATLRVRARREDARMKKLRPAGLIRVHQYEGLRDLVEELERDHPNDASRYELQDLLSHFVRLAAMHQQCIDALRVAGPGLVPVVNSAPPSQRRQDLATRRSQHRDACITRIQWLRDELDAIEELIRLIAQRAACPDLDSDIGREIDRRVWELDEVDAALAQLSA